MSKSQSILTIKDSVFVVTYNRTFKLPDYFTTTKCSIVIDSSVSYFFSMDYDDLEKSKMRNPAIIKNTDSILFCQPMMPKYDHFTYFSDTLHPMKWEITGNKIDLKGRVGYEATTFFRGRFYTAYYDPNVPFSNGPMKFGGLPGLIIKIYDRERLWDYELISIKREVNKHKPNKINYAGDFTFFLSIYPEWRRRAEEKFAATETTDPNCPTCGSKSVYYSLELYE